MYEIFFNFVKNRNWDDEPLIVAYKHTNISNISRSFRFLLLLPKYDIICSHS